MNTKATLTVTHWLIIIIASLGFLFDTYQLLMMMSQCVTVRVALVFMSGCGWFSRRRRAA